MKMLNGFNLNDYMANIDMAFLDSQVAWDSDDRDRWMAGRRDLFNTVASTTYLRITPKAWTAKTAEEYFGGQANNWADGIELGMFAGVDRLIEVAKIVAMNEADGDDMEIRYGIAEGMSWKEECDRWAREEYERWASREMVQR